MKAKHYREIIRECHQDRIRINPHYSLRSFARDLALTPSQLSLVLNGKKGLSPERARKIFTHLLADPELVKNCTLQVQAEHSRSRTTRLKASKKLENISRDYESITLTRHAFDVISNWHHFAILQSLAVANVPKTRLTQTRWLSEKLKVPRPEVDLAVNRMIELELLTAENDRLQVCHETVLTSNGVPSTALRNFHRQIMTKALEAIEGQSIQERVLSSGIFPTRKKDIPQMEVDIAKFQRSMVKKYGRIKENDADCVYSLSLQLFKMMEQA